MKLKRYPMPAKLYRVKLLEAERNDLKALINKSRVAARKQTHVRILLHCDESGVVPAKRDQEIAEAMNTSGRSVERVRQRFVEEGLESALNPKGHFIHAGAYPSGRPFYYTSIYCGKLIAKAKIC
jgi:hypothetical protein